MTEAYIYDAARTPRGKGRPDGSLQHPPVPAVWADKDAEADYVVASGKGTVFSFVVHHAPKVPGRQLPFVVALVELVADPDGAVGGVGQVKFSPNSRNVLPGKVVFTVDIRTVDFATWLDEQNNGNFDMLMMGWLGNIDPDDFYYAQHHTDGASNAQKYSNPTVDDLLDRARVETDRDARKDLYAQAARIIADDASYIYLYNPSVIQVWSLSVTGYETRADRAIRFRDTALAG